MQRKGICRGPHREEQEKFEKVTGIKNCGGVLERRSSPVITRLQLTRGHQIEETWVLIKGSVLGKRGCNYSEPKI